MSDILCYSCKYFTSMGSTCDLGNENDGVECEDYIYCGDINETYFEW